MDGTRLHPARQHGDEGCEEIAETYNEEGFEGLQRMLEASSLEYVYYTEADADGDA